MAPPVSIADLSNSGKVAEITAESELLTTSIASRSNVASRYKITGVNATKWVVLVDLSDTVNWPHEPGEHLHCNLYSIQVDRAANSVGSVDIGVVTRVDGTNGDVYFMSSCIFTNSSDNHLYIFDNYSPNVARCSIENDRIAELASNDAILNSTAIQTDVPLDSFLGAATVAPQVGDCVIRFNYVSGGAYDAIATLFYRAG